RLDRALAALDASAPVRIAMVHYPPVGPALPDEHASEPAGTSDPAAPGAPRQVWKLPGNELTQRFEEAAVGQVVFGHLHALDPRQRARIGGKRHGVRYILAAVDFVGFQPVELSPA